MSTIASENVAAPFDKEQLLSAFRAMTPADMADILEEMQRGMDLWRARQSADAESMPAASASAPAKKAAVRKPKAAAAPPAAAAAPLPDAEDGEAPPASAYRLSAIAEDVCVGRRFKENGEEQKDNRWKPAIFREVQCGSAVEGESDLCTGCKRRLAKYTESPSPKADWLGRVSEEPLDWMHMLGTAWAAKANPRFGAGSGAVSETASVASAPAAKPARKSKQTEEEKAAKAAAAAEAKAAKEAEKAAAKEAEKAAAKAAKAAEQKVRDAKKAAAAATAVPAPAAKADTATPAATVAHKIVCVAGEMYAIRGSCAYEYNPLDDSVGSYAGRLSADGNAVDTEAPEADE